MDGDLGSSGERLRVVLECRPSSKNGRIWNPKQGNALPRDPGTQWQSPGSWYCPVRTLWLRVLGSVAEL